MAGRVRSSWATSNDEIEFRDGTHGLLVWALATLITALLAMGAATAATRLAAPSAGSAGASTSVAGENIIAYDLDRLFRAEKRPADVDMTYPRAEAARILLTSAGHSGITSDDRTYLIRLVSAQLVSLLLTPSVAPTLRLRVLATTLAGPVAVASSLHSWPVPLRSSARRWHGLQLVWAVNTATRRLHRRCG